MFECCFHLTVASAPYVERAKMRSPPFRTCLAVTALAVADEQKSKFGHGPFVEIKASSHYTLFKILLQVTLFLLIKITQRISVLVENFGKNRLSIEKKILVIYNFIPG